MTAWNIVFHLNRASRKTASGNEREMVAKVERGSATLRVTGVEADTDDEAHESAESFGNRLLDDLATGHNEALKIEGPDWGSETMNPDGGKSIRMRESASITVSGSLTTRHFDANGNLLGDYDSENLGRIDVKNSNARRYYRQALLSKDAFDRFRNLYLASENIAADARRQGRTKDMTSLEQAINMCFSGARLKDLAARIPMTCSSTSGQPVPNVVAAFLKGIRDQLNHSATSNIKVPYNSNDQEAVRSAMPLLEFVTKGLLDFEEVEGFVVRRARKWLE